MGNSPKNSTYIPLQAFFIFYNGNKKTGHAHRKYLLTQKRIIDYEKVPPYNDDSEVYNYEILGCLNYAELPYEISSIENCRQTFSSYGTFTYVEIILIEQVCGGSRLVRYGTQVEKPCNLEIKMDEEFTRISDKLNYLAVCIDQIAKNPKKYASDFD